MRKEMAGSFGKAGAVKQMVAAQHAKRHAVLIANYIFGLTKYYTKRS
jgi:hypothetical protein